VATPIIPQVPIAIAVVVVVVAAAVVFHDE